MGFNDIIMVATKDFILQAIEDSKPVFLNQGFQKVKVVDILTSTKISKAKFFRYFGGMRGIMELTIYHELSQCYRLIALKIQHTKNREELLGNIIAMRKKLVAGNPILKQYFATKDFFSTRLEPLKKAIKQNEGDLLQGFLEKYFFSEPDITYFKYCITKDS